MKKIIVLIGILFIVGIIAFSARGILGSRKLPSVPGLSGAKSSLNIDLNQIKPATWQAFNKKLIPLSIDDDEDSEWIMFYLYEGHNIGGVIYDPQTTPLGNEKVPIPDQSATFLVPYRLLPDYQFNKTTGYLGDDDIDYRTAIALPNYDPPKIDRLLVRGFENKRITRFSSFWWINEIYGYGGSHVSTSGWLSLSHDDPHDWLLWKNKTADITTLWAWEPLHDRSNLCRRVKWQLIEENENDAINRHFQKGPATDITFCNGQTPQEPAFPEAQVLAYLQDGNGKRLLQSDNNRFPRYPHAIIDQIVAPLRLDIASTDAGNSQPTIQVEVDVDFTMDGDLFLTRWTVAMIRPATIKETIHWRIVNVKLR